MNVRAQTTGVHWKGRGWYAPKQTGPDRLLYFYVGPQSTNTLERARAKAAERGLGEPILVISREGFTHVY